MTQLATLQSLYCYNLCKSDSRYLISSCYLNLKLTCNILKFIQGKGLCGKAWLTDDQSFLMVNKTDGWDFVDSIILTNLAKLQIKTIQFSVYNSSSAEKAVRNPSLFSLISCVSLACHCVTVSLELH